MEQIPLQIRLKREVHRKIASAQDLIVKEVYSVFNKAVLHGGTAIWRCYSGKRFSEDLDFYLPKDKEKIEQLFENLKKGGFEIKKKKISDRSIYSELELARTSVRLEATFQDIPGVICDYEQSDGNFISIYSLTPEAFLAEKINTYLKRFKVRDLWDIFFLLKSVKDLKQIKEMAAFIKNYKQPVDEENLKAILLEGIVPSAQEMLIYIHQKWEQEST
ncbi:nucleotidyl transferase AbiEii/AbiGii toxin family protein [Candidatus Woesearchaeota archaeon]|nr:nucleotidyl transferase AbiEii/AbiGii toxin family protein [Candidatus Woesearchaeota archaeon]